MKRICHVTTVHPRYDNRIFQKECKSLVEKGYEVFLIVNDNNIDETLDGVTIISMRKKRKSRIMRILFSPWDAYKEAKKVHANLYHLHDPELLFIAKKLKKSSNVFFDSHEFTAEQILNKFYIPKIIRRPLANVYRYLEKSIISKIDGLIVPCTYAGKDYFKNCYKRIAYVNNVPMLENLKTVDIPYEKRAIETLYLGGITLQRGAKAMIKAAYQANSCLSIGGDFSPVELQSDLEKMKEYSTVNYLGVLNQQQVQNVLSNSKIGICILQDSGQYKNLDNLPTKIYEYMAAGIPVIASDFPYYKRVIEGNKAGICVEPSDTNAIAEAIRYLVEHSNEAREMGENGKKLIENTFNWECEKQNLFKIYEAVLYE